MLFHEIHQKHQLGLINSLLCWQRTGLGECHVETFPEVTKAPMAIWKAGGLFWHFIPLYKKPQRNIAVQLPMFIEQSLATDFLWVTWVLAALTR